MISEGKLQQICFMWAWNAYPHLRGLLCYNLNNSKNKIDGNLNKGKGLIAGRSDMVFYYKGVATMIELKTENGKQSDAQIDWEAKIKAQGFDYYIIRSLEEFQRLFNSLVI
jgi:hypothetical protein